jgi:tetratricopeptide (TPR) repeat protein
MQQFYPSGTRVAGRYEIAGAPLMGGMGVVYLCFDHQEQRPVALKTFRPEYLPDRAARDRFLQEGETWVRLGKHPHIVRCYQVFQDSPRPEVYLALELVAKEEGRRDASLRAWITPGQPLPVDQALLIALQIARGMSHAADVIPGFVHRDLKPENVLVGADRLTSTAINRVRVTDFGLVKDLRAELVGALVGTPLYMAPEQWEGADVTVQADVYALGCILGEMITGHMLVQGKALDELRRAHQGGQALAAARTASAVLSDLLGGCLATEPAQRYASWGVVEAGLAAAYRTATGQPAPGAEAAGALSRAERVAAGWSYNAVGASYRQIGNAQAALGYFQRVHQAGRAEEEPRLEAAGLGNLGNAYLQLGDARRAIKYHEQALVISQEIAATAASRAPSWAAWGWPTPTWATPGGPSGTTSRHWRSTGRSATAVARAATWATWGTPTCNWGTPGGPSGTTSRHWRSAGRSATAAARATPWATWGAPTANWVMPGGPSGTTSRHWRSTGRSATARARAATWAAWGTPTSNWGTPGGPSGTSSRRWPFAARSATAAARAVAWAT